MGNMPTHLIAFKQEMSPEIGRLYKDLLHLSKIEDIYSEISLKSVGMYVNEVNTVIFETISTDTTMLH